MVKRILVLICVGVGLSMLIACGQKSETPQTPAAAPEKKAAAADAGVKLGEEILSVFDQCVAEAAALAKDKPEAAVLIPQLEKLYAGYGEKMAALNTRFLALRDQDIFRFREANGYLSGNRPQRVFNKDNTLRQAIVYYNLEKGEQAVVDMLSNRIVKLLDDAVKQ